MLIVSTCNSTNDPVEQDAGSLPPRLLLLLVERHCHEEPGHLRGNIILLLLSAFSPHSVRFPFRDLTAVSNQKTLQKMQFFHL